MRVTTKYYCGIDLHTQTMYVVITNKSGKIQFDKDLPANPIELKKAISKYKKDIVVGVKCIFS